MEEKIKLLVSFIFSIIIKVLGGWDIWLMSLLTVMFLDILTGLIKAILMRSNKSESGGLSSASMFHGGIKKVFILLMVALGTVLDTIISPEDVFIRIMVVSYYIANESLSILENVGASGVPLPKVLYKILDSLKTNNME
ncbi:MAG: phage holin family protein [Clostridia bacterium]|nr:phage holin family protein [Clostridia bacterium]